MMNHDFPELPGDQSEVKFEAFAKAESPDLMKRRQVLHGFVGFKSVDLQVAQTCFQYTNSCSNNDLDDEMEDHI